MKNIKRISLEEWNKIGQYNHASKWARKICRYSLIQFNGKMYRKQTVSPIIYALLFIPLSIISFFYCCYDGGIKEFEFPDFVLGCDELFYESKEIAKKIWENH